MVSLTHPKNPLSLHIFSNMNKSSSSSTLTTTMKLKTLIHNLIFSHICGVVRAFSKTKSMILDILSGNHLICMKQTQRKNKYMKKIIFGSFRLHYNWCSSSHVMPFPSWNSVLSSDDHNNDHHDLLQDDFYKGNYGKEEEGQLSSYLQWLEESKGGCKHEISNNGEGNIENEIDKLADIFIASCHEKFKLEKIESYRRYQDMLARTI